MGSYFSTLMQHYGPADASTTVLPDGPDPADVDQTVAPPPPPQPSDPIADIQFDPPPDPEPVGNANSFQPAPAPDPFDPSDFQETHSTPDGEKLASSEQIITEVTERVIHEIVRPVEEDTDTPEAQPHVETHLHEAHQTDVHLTETHVLETTLPPPSDPELTTPELPLPAEINDKEAPQNDGREAMLDALESHLENVFANLTNPQRPPAISIVDTADFEPEVTDQMPPLTSDDPREVTREIVKEIHHHHHETKLVSEKAPAPRTAANASQIGPIRLSSYWGMR